MFRPGYVHFHYFRTLKLTIRQTSNTPNVFLLVLQTASSATPLWSLCSHPINSFGVLLVFVYATWSCRLWSNPWFVEGGKIWYTIGKQMDLEAVFSPSGLLCGVKIILKNECAKWFVADLFWNQETCFFSWETWFIILYTFSFQIQPVSLQFLISFLLLLYLLRQLISCHQPQREWKWKETWQRLWSSIFFIFSRTKKWEVECFVLKILVPMCWEVFRPLNLKCKKKNTKSNDWKTLNTKAQGFSGQRRSKPRK